MKKRLLPLLLALIACVVSTNLFAQSVPAPPPNPPTLPPSTPTAPQPERDEDEYRVFAEPTTEWELHKTADAAHPDGNEQAMVWLMNRARSNPTEEGLYLAATGHARVESAINGFGVDIDLMKSEFAEIAPKQPAAFDRRIYEGSREHALYMISVDDQNHDGQFDRVDDAGFVANGAGASVFYRAEDPVQAHAAYNIDWGGANDGDGMQEGRGHRVNLMNDNSFPLTNVGIAMVPDDDAGTDAGPLVNSIVYAQASPNAADHFNKFLVGTVWDDLNENGIYDPGEGLAGVTVTPNEGTYYAVTSDAGGYAIPVVADGMYVVGFSGGDLSQPDQRTVTVAGESVLVVWNAADSYNGINVVAPNLKVVPHPDGLTISWTPDADHEYAVQTSLDGEVWTDDDREITTEGDTASFEVTNDEIESTLLLRLKVSGAESE